MALKRAAAEADIRPLSTRRADTKRARPSSPTDPSGDSSASSTCSVSEDSALDSSPPASAETRRTSLSTMSDEESSLSESSLSESSSDSEDDTIDEEDEDVQSSQRSSRLITSPIPKKPPIGLQRSGDGGGELLTRLREFMPKLEEANRELTAKGTGASMEDVGENEAHIEMNLGLGVLEEKHEDDSESDEDEDDREQDVEVMQKLLGIRDGVDGTAKPNIQEMEDAGAKGTNPER